MVKYQVFVSSTYQDLIEERQLAVQGILRTHHIPAGMELFAAGNETQLEVIKNWIDDSDIYMLVLGDRYGSIEPQSQLSYTELEYRYAIEKGKPVFALVLSEKVIDEKIHKEGKKVIELENRPKFETFKKEILSRICHIVHSVSTIEYETARAIQDIISSSKYNLTGWIKNDPTVLKNIKKKAFQPLNAQSYGLQILSPEFGAILSNPVLMTGTYEKEPPKGMFYAFEFNPQIETYWPKYELIFDKVNKTWRSVLAMGKGDNLDRLMLVVAVGEFGKEIIDDFYNTPMHRGMVELSFDMVEVAQIRITLKAAEKS